ncbi:MAG TPA: 5'-nucleotidase C-terminal domain-containing protein [Methylomirabilota bacterium]|nr:5'-nucleotidase C-terminal domain-containing protein [Methylomirabilota bacterium]
MPARPGLLLLALLAASACAPIPCAERPPERVQLLSVNDVYQLEPSAAGRGGLARVATLVRGLRRETPHTLFALAGDTLAPSLLSTLVRGRQMVEAWNALGLDVATFGNHEFDFGAPTLLERMRESRFLWLSANVLERDTGRPFGGARPWLRRELGSVSVGLVGVTLPETARSSNAGPGIRFAPPVVAARSAVGAMGPVDLRVAVTHLPLVQDRELAAVVPLHVILGGHDHDPMITEQGSTLIVKAGSDAVNVGRVEYEVGCGGRVFSRRERLIPVDASIAEAPDAAALVRRYAALVERELDTPVGRTPVPLEARDAVVRREETSLGRWLAEVMRERVGAEVGLLNSGAIRANRILPPGSLTRRDFRELLPFDNTVVLLEVTGAALKAALEHSVEALPRPSGKFLQTAGLVFRVDPGAPAGRRVEGVLVQGTPLEPDRDYRVAVPDYLARGGDGYAMLAGGRMLLGPEDGPGLIDTVFQALAEGRSP